MMSTGKVFFPILLATILHDRYSVKTEITLERYASQIYRDTSVVPTQSAELLKDATTIYTNNTTETRRYTYVAYIYLEEGGAVWRCGGSLIAEDLVLTAAHCLPGNDYFYGSVTIGGYETYDNEPQKNYKVSGFEIHPDYLANGYPDNDFAIVKLDRCSGTRPVLLNRTGRDNIVDGAMVTVLGWEDTFNDDGYEQYTTIQESFVYLNQECEPWRSKNNLGTLTDNMLCTSLGVLSKPAIPKRGDSGGALLIKGDRPEEDVQIGVVSFGYDKPGRKDHVPTVHGNVGAAFHWITGVRDRLSQCSR